jgi:hypothetical protein
MATPNTTKTKFLDGDIDLASDTFKVLLLNDSQAYTFDPSRDSTVQDVLNNATEFSTGGTNYSRKTLSNQSTSTDDTDNEGVFDADDLTWADLGGSETIQAVIVYRQIGGDDTTPGDDEVITALDDGDISELPLPTNGGDVSLSWNTEGILNLA